MTGSEAVSSGRRTLVRPRPSRDIHGVLARLEGHGARLVGEVVRYEDAYLLCYVRGPEGIIVGLAQPLS